MHSFQPSRGRIFFEVLCAVGIAASLGGAWTQTGASALLGAAGVAALYSLVHFFDLFRRGPSVAAEPQRIEFEPEPVIDTPARQDVGAQLARIEKQLTAYQAVEQAPVVDMALPEVTPLVETAEPPPAGKTRTKAPRKASSGRSRASKKTKAAEQPLADIVDYVSDEPIDSRPIDAGEPPAAEEPFHRPAAPLFDPEPMVRQQQRAMFGRKSG